MIRRRVLVTGASGLLGTVLVKSWQDRYWVAGASRSHKLQYPNIWIRDLTDSGAAEELVGQTKPDLVVHAAALTDVDACEAEPALAMRVNAEATGRLAAAARRAGSAFVYISTDSVFDGARGGYRETDRPNPINRYAASKLAGEQETLSSHQDAIVLRVGLEGWRHTGRPGFVQWVAEGLRRGEHRTVCTDWVHTVVFAGNLAEVVERLWTMGGSGIYHVGADRPASNWEIARATAVEFRLAATLLIPITSDKLQLRASRPPNTSLISDKLREVIGPVVWDLSSGLAHMRTQELSGELATLHGLVSP